MIPEFLGAASLFGSLFGGDDREATPEMRSSQSSYAQGYAALPEQGQQAWNNFFNMLNQLAARSGNFPELNRVQQNALSRYANPDFSKEGLAPYANPFQEMVQKQAEAAINRGYDMDRSRLTDRFAQRGSQIRPGSNSALNTQLSQLSESKNRTLGDIIAGLGYQGYNEALGLRQNTLANMLQAGNTIQEAPYRNIGLYGQLASLIPQSGYGQETSNSTGAIGARPSFLSKLGGAGAFLGSSGYGNYMNNFKTNFKNFF